MLWRYICLLGLVLIIYLCLGAVGFHFIEYPRESETRIEQAYSLRDFLVNNTCVSQDQLELFVTGLLKAYDAGVLVTSSSSSESNWDYASSLFFSLTVVTTIGYGHISPSTVGGQAFFVIYALIGIPLCGAFILNIGLKLQKPLQKLLSIASSSKCTKTVQVITVCLFVTISLVVLLFGPAAVFAAIEDWTYGEALYYCVVTMTTVGFGDYVPGQSEKEYRALYRIMVMVWILVGYAWLAMILSKVTDLVVQKLQNKNSVKDKENNKESEDELKTEDKVNAVETKAV